MQSVENTRLGHVIGARKNREMFFLPFFNSSYINLLNYGLEIMVDH